MNYLQQIEAACQKIASVTASKPQLGLVLGSGLGDMADALENKVVIPYTNIPHFPVSTVAGHKGQLVIGELNGKSVVAMQGRFHYYEGYTMRQVVFPIYVMKALGVQTLFVTNAAGGLNPRFSPGDLMVINDHLNLTGDNPLVGENYDELGPRFPDMSHAYTPALRELAQRVAARLGYQLQEGVYAGYSGPMYETPAELLMLRKFGGDAVGMSTVPEVIAANHAGLQVLGITCVTDMALGESLQPLSHAEVVEVANRTKPIFIRLLAECIREVTLS